MSRNVQSKPSVDDSVGGTPPSQSALCWWQPKHHKKDFAFLKVLPLLSGGKRTPWTQELTQHPRAPSAKKKKIKKSRCKTQCHGTFPTRIISVQLSAVLPAVLISGSGLYLWSWESTTCSFGVKWLATLLCLCTGAAVRTISVTAKCFWVSWERERCRHAKSYYPYISQRN